MMIATLRTSALHCSALLCFALLCSERNTALFKWGEGLRSIEVCVFLITRNRQKLQGQGRELGSAVSCVLYVSAV